MHEPAEVRVCISLTAVRQLLRAAGVSPAARRTEAMRSRDYRAYIELCVRAVRVVVDVVVVDPQPVNTRVATAASSDITIMLVFIPWIRAAEERWSRATERK